MVVNAIPGDASVAPLTSAAGFGEVSWTEAALSSQVVFT